MLLQLEVENYLLKVEVEEAALMLLDELQDLVPRQLAPRSVVQLPLVQLLDQLVVGERAQVLVVLVLPQIDLLQKPLLQLACIDLVVHFLNNSPPHPLIDDAWMDEAAILASARRVHDHLRLRRRYLALAAPHVYHLRAHRLNLIHELADLRLILEWEPVAKQDPQEIVQRVAYMHLYEPKFLIALVLQNLAEEADVVVVILVRLDAID